MKSGTGGETSMMEHSAFEKEYAWGLAKRFYRRQIKLKDMKKNFGGSVNRTLRVISVDHCRKFLERTRRYAMTHLLLDEEDVEHSDIERFVKVSKTHRSATDQETSYLSDLIADLRKNRGT